MQLTGTAIAGETAHLFSPHRSLGAVDWVLLVVGPVALVARRRHPVPVLWVSLAATLTPVASGFAHVQLRRRVLRGGHRREALLGLAGRWHSPSSGRSGSPRSFTGTRSRRPTTRCCSRGGCWRWRSRPRRPGSGPSGWPRPELAVRLEQRRHQSEERLRIARDLHDVIGHNISLINVQASMGLDLMDSQPEQARAALSAIKSASKEALEELRTMLTTLRHDDDDAPRSPAPGLDRLPELIELTRAAGLSVEVEVAGKAPPLPTAVHLAVYRIIQESLTNVARHAGRARVTVRVTYDDADVHVEIDDDGALPSEGASSIGTGSGITGMRERATALGGDLSAGFRQGGGFRVSARLPVRPAP